MREASELPQPSIVDVDPEDPSQLLDEGTYNIVDLGVEAQPHAEADADLDAAVAEADADENEEDDVSEIDTPEDTTADAYAAEADDTGDLYGIHTPRAADRDLDTTPDREQFVDSNDGENWLETLGKKAAEGGVAAEQEVVVIDDSDEHRGHHSTERDRPVADKGSGGDGGL
ncbi:MAG TPA: hypothetical protein VIV40_06955 [Kofleriaceae bacterium]